MATKESLPEDLIADILSKLPVKSLLRFRCVCKPWCALIADPLFVKMHLNRSLATNTNHSLIFNKFASLYSVNLEDVKLDHRLESLIFRPKDVLGTCNGLICISNYANDIYLWNPSTRRHLKLPITPIDHILYDSAYGLGYDPITDDYKLVRIVNLFDKDDNFSSLHLEVMVYSLHTNSWRKAGKMPFSGFNGHWKRGVFANSTLHWVANVKAWGPYNGLGIIVSFDLKDEKCREVPLPHFVDDDDFVEDNFLMNVGVLGGQLCLLCNFRIRVEIWVMKDYGVRDSWVKQCITEDPFATYLFVRFTPICYSKNGEIILRGGRGRKGLVVYYDPHTEKSTYLRNCTPDSLVMDICIGSLVPLNMPKTN